MMISLASLALNTHLGQLLIGMKHYVKSLVHAVIPCIPHIIDTTTNQHSGNWIFMSIENDDYYVDFLIENVRVINGSCNASGMRRAKSEKIEKREKSESREQRKSKQRVSRN